MSSHSLNAKMYEPNPALRVLNRWFFDKMKVDDQWVRGVREISRRGTVVYVLRSRNVVDYLALDHLTKRYELPRIRYVNDLSFGAIGVEQRPWLRLLAPTQMPETARLREALVGGGSAALFLKRPPGVIDVAAGASGGRGLRQGDEHVRTLIQLQRETERPILLVPQVFVWTNRPDTHGTQLLDFVLGPREWPSLIRTVGQALYNYKHVELRAGDALDLHEYMQSEAGASDEVMVRRVIYAVLRRLERERRTATGPALQRPDRQRLQVLRSPKLQAAIAHMAGERAEDRNTLNRHVLKMVQEMQATPDSATIKALEVLLDRVFHRIYAGIELDMQGLARIRELSREGSIVLLPSHKSYVDFLVLSFLFNEHNLQMPMIAAGDNLSFFPLGPILRRAGGFFIRRSFRGDKLYSMVVEAYVRRLLRDGHTLELFVEGGRSRTGKLLQPKFGMLSMIVDAALQVPKRPVYFVPISIGYERIIETGAYGEEMTGGEKEKEDAAGLLRSTEVLRHRYGRIDVQFGRELTLDDIRRDIKVALDAELTPAKKRALVTRLANRTMDEINRVTAITPGALTALALLSDRRRSISHGQLLERCQHLLGTLRTMGARMLPLIATGGVLRPAAIREALQLFEDAELVESHRAGVAELAPAPALRGGALREERRESQSSDETMYRVPERKRLELDTTKNHIVHFFVERGLCAVSVLAEPGPPVAVDIVRDRVRNLSKLFKHEFRFHADASFDTIFERTIAAMVAGGELAYSDEEHLTLGEGRDDWPASVWLQTYSAIIRNFIEGYRVAARGLTLLLKGPLNEKDLVRRSLIVGDRMYLANEIELREAISKPLVSNALVAFREEGYLQLRDGKYALSPTFADPDAVATIEGRMSGFCGNGAR